MNQNIIPSTWNKTTYKQFVVNLKKQEDLNYKEFTQKIVFTNYEIIGIRVPILREISKKIKKTNIIDFLNVSIPTTHEEIFLRGVIVSYIKDYHTFLKIF